MNDKQYYCIASSLFALAMALLAACAQYVTLTVTNRGEQPVRQVHISYTGGSINIPELSPKASRIVRIRPTGESSLAVRFVDASGREQTKNADVYFERDYNGEIAVDLRPNGEVVVQANVRPR